MHDVLYTTYSVWGIDLSNQSESPWMISPGTSSQTFTRRSNERWILYVQVCSFHYMQLSLVQNADCKFTELPTVSHPLFPESWSHPLNKNCCDSDRNPPTSACFAWSSLIPVSIAALQLSRSSLAKSELSASPAAPKHPQNLGCATGSVDHGWPWVKWPCQHHKMNFHKIYCWSSPLLDGHRNWTSCLRNHTSGVLKIHRLGTSPSEWDPQTRSKSSARNLEQRLVARKWGWHLSRSSTANQIGSLACPRSRHMRKGEWDSDSSVFSAGRSEIETSETDWNSFKFQTRSTDTVPKAFETKSVCASQ